MVPWRPEALQISHAIGWELHNKVKHHYPSFPLIPPGRNFLLPGSESATMSAVAVDPQGDATDATSSSTPIEEPEKKKRQYKDFSHDDEKATREFVDFMQSILCGSDARLDAKVDMSTVCLLFAWMCRFHLAYTNVRPCRLN